MNRSRRAGAGGCQIVIGEGLEEKVTVDSWYCLFGTEHVVLLFSIVFINIWKRYIPGLSSLAVRHGMAGKERREAPEDIWVELVVYWFKGTLRLMGGLMGCQRS